MATATLPSSARAQGLNGAFYTTDVTASNVGNSSADLTFKFLGNNKDGTGGEEKTYAIAAGKTQTFTDILGSVFGRTSDYGAISVSSDSLGLAVLGQTSTPGFGGTFGQSVPVAVCYRADSERCAPVDCGHSRGRGFSNQPDSE